MGEEKTFFDMLYFVFGGVAGMKLREGLSIVGGETWKCVSEPRSMIYPFLPTDD